MDNSRSLRGDSPGKPVVSCPKRSNSDLIPLFPTEKLEQLGATGATGATAQSGPEGDKTVVVEKGSVKWSSFDHVSVVKTRKDVGSQF